MNSTYDPLLGRVKLVDETEKVIEKHTEIRGGGGGVSGLAIVQADEPSSASQGQLWLDTDDDTLYVYANGVWVAISGGGTSGGTFDFVDGGDFQFIDGTYFDFVT